MKKIAPSIHIITNSNLGLQNFYLISLNVCISFDTENLDSQRHSHVLYISEINNMNVIKDNTNLEKKLNVPWNFFFPLKYSLFLGMFGQFIVLKSNHLFIITLYLAKVVLMQYLHLREITFPVGKERGIVTYCNF